MSDFGSVARVATRQAQPSIRDGTREDPAPVLHRDDRTTSKRPTCRQTRLDVAIVTDSRRDWATARSPSLAAKSQAQGQTVTVVYDGDRRPEIHLFDLQQQLLDCWPAAVASPAAMAVCCTTTPPIGRSPRQLAEAHGRRPDDANRGGCHRGGAAGHAASCSWGVARTGAATGSSSIGIIALSRGDGPAVVSRLVPDRRDFHDLRRRLAILEARFHDFTGLISDWIWETDQEFRLTYVSSRVTEVLGSRPRAASGPAPRRMGWPAGRARPRSGTSTPTPFDAWEVELAVACRWRQAELPPARRA